MTAQSWEGTRWLPASRGLLVLAALVSSSFTGQLLAAEEEEEEAEAEEAETSVALRRAIVPTTLPRDGVVHFPGAGSVNVVFRKAPEERYPESPWQDYPTLLRAAQAGDPASAGIVGGLLVRCAKANGVPYSAGDPRSLRVPMKMPEFGPQDSALREFCSHRVKEELSSAMTWLRQAAGAGDLGALKALSRLYRPGSNDHIDVLTVIWEQGSVTALHELAVAYRFRNSGPGAQPLDATNALASA